MAKRPIILDSGLALTFDDVLLVPAASDVMPSQVDVSSRITRTIRINIPILSSAMDTVTEAELAIAIALEGGLGFIHKNMSIEKQAAQVRKVKRSQAGMILDPITLNINSKVRDAEAIMREFHIGGIPVVDENKVLKGIITNRDLRFIKDPNRLIREIMTRENLITAKSGISLEQAEEVLQEYKIEKLPIVDEDGKLTGLITYKDILKRKDKPFACKDEFGRLRVGAAVGVKLGTREGPRDGANVS
jgi:IMP dehydrogenase